MDVTSGDVVTIVAQYTSVAVTSSYAYISVVSTGTFTLTSTCNNVQARYTSGYTSATGSIGGWEESEMRTYLKETIKPLIPSTVSAAIKTVSKSQPAYNTSGSSFTQTTEDDVWIPSYAEIYGTSCTYKAVYSSADDRIKYKVGATSASLWWLRTAYATNFFRYISASGSLSYLSAYSSYGVALGFCI